MSDYKNLLVEKKGPAMVLIGPRGGKYVRTRKKGSKHYVEAP